VYHLKNKKGCPCKGAIMKTPFIDYVIVVVFGIAFGYFLVVYFTGV